MGSQKEHCCREDGEEVTEGSSGHGHQLGDTPPRLVPEAQDETWKQHAGRANEFLQSPAFTPALQQAPTRGLIWCAAIGGGTPLLRRARRTLAQRLSGGGASELSKWDEGRCSLLAAGSKPSCQAHANGGSGVELSTQPATARGSHNGLLPHEGRPVAGQDVARHSPFADVEGAGGPPELATPFEAARNSPISEGTTAPSASLASELHALPLLASLKRLRLPSIAEVDRSPATGGRLLLAKGKPVAAGNSRRDLRRAVGCRESPLKAQLDRCFTDDSAQLLQVQGVLLVASVLAPAHCHEVLQKGALVGRKRASSAPCSGWTACVVSVIWAPGDGWYYPAEAGLWLLSTLSIAWLWVCGVC